MDDIDGLSSLWILAWIVSFSRSYHKYIVKQPNILLLVKKRQEERSAPPSQHLSTNNNHLLSACPCRLSFNQVFLFSHFCYSCVQLQWPHWQSFKFGVFFRSESEICICAHVITFGSLLSWLAASGSIEAHLHQYKTMSEKFANMRSSLLQISASVFRLLMPFKTIDKSSLAWANVFSFFHSYQIFVRSIIKHKTLHLQNCKPFWGRRLLPTFFFSSNQFSPLLCPFVVQLIFKTCLIIIDIVSKQ